MLKIVHRTLRRKRDTVCPRSKWKKIVLSPERHNLGTVKEDAEEGREDENE